MSGKGEEGSKELEPWKVRQLQKQSGTRPPEARTLDVKY